MLLFITLKVSYYSTGETLKEGGQRGGCILYIYVKIYAYIYKKLLFFLQNISFFCVPFCFIILFLPPPHPPPQFAKNKKKNPHPVFPDSKDYHPDIFSLIIPFAQQPGRETQAAWQKMRGPYLWKLFLVPLLSVVIQMPSFSHIVTVSPVGSHRTA